MSKDTFRAIVLEPEKPAEVREIGRSKEAVEEILGKSNTVGLIFLTEVDDGKLYIAVCDDGQNNSLPRNRLDMRGNAIILKISKHEMVELDLTEEECNKLLNEIRTWP